MAVGTGIGFDLSFLDKLDEADKKLDQFIKTSQGMSSKVIKSWQDIAVNGIDPFLQKMKDQKTALESIANMDLSGAGEGMKKLASEASAALVSVNQVVDGLTKLAQGRATYDASAGLYDLKKIDDQIKAKERAEEKETKDRAAAYAQREKELNDFFNKEVAAEEKAYQRWLELKERERATNEAVETEKHNRAIQNIGRQNAEYQKGEDARYQKWLELKDKEAQREQADADAKWQRQKNTVYQQNAQYAAEELRQKQKNAEEEKRINQQISKERIDQLGRESREKLKIEQMIRDTQKKNHDAREKELNNLFREQERQLKAQAKADSETRRLKYKAYTTSYAGAIYTSDHANTLAKEIKAVKNLEAARAKLTRTDQDYYQKLNAINRRIAEHNRNIERATAATKEHNKALAAIGRGVASAFSVQALRGYVNNLIKVRGEFELQQRSLQALLQSKDDADRLWQQTIDLAVKSPFRISELVSYTKQLAAYQIESEKLFETNKMLADVSAGLGVDMQRLILAFGQVKAANFLRGTELRQFTEAGVPMLEELARHFSELEGTAVSVGDVFERISKRMVSFGDVEAVFRNITSAGGDFYRMQEIQSETLKGQIRNLKDSIDLMLNSIGKATDSTLKWGVGAIKSLVDNWQLVTKSIEGVIVALAMYKLQAALVSKSMIALANTLGVINDEAATQITLQQLLKVGWRSLINPIKNAASAMYNFAAAHPVLLAVTVAIAGLLKILRQWNTVNTNIENFVKKLDEAKRAANELSVAFQFGDTSEQRSSLLSLIGLANREYKMKIGLDADSIKDMDTSELEAKFVEIREAIFDANAFAYSFAEAMEKDAFKQWLGNLIDDDVFEDIDDFGKRAEQLDAQVRNSMKSIVASVLDSGVTLDDYQKQLLESLTIPKGVNESNYRYVERLEEAFKGLSGVFKAAGVDVDETEKAFRRFGRATKEVEKEFKDFVKGFKISSELSDEQKAYQLKFAIDKLGFEKEWGEFERDLLYRLAEEEYNVTIGIQSDTSAQTLEPWANRVYDAITKVNEKIKKENPDFKGGLFPLPQVGQTKEQYVAAAKAVIDVAKATYNDIQQIEEDSTVQRTKALSPYVTEVEKILNLFKDSGRDGGRDEVLEKLKNRINLIKEMNKEYEKLNKTFSKAESLAKVQKAYADTAKELGLDTSTMDFTDEGTIKSLEALLGKPEYAANKYVIELQKALDNFKVELGVEVKQEKDKDLKAQVQELFDQYDLSLELKKLNIPKDLAKSLFDVDYLDLDGLKKAVQEQEAKFIGTDMEDEYKKFLEKIDEMERKSIVERTKTYAEYLTRGMNERVKLKVEELRKLKELEESKEFNPDQKEQIRGQIKADTQKALDKESWKQFQATEWYTLMFTDLETLGTQAIKNLHDELSQLKDSLSHLDPSEVKEIVNQMDKLQEQLIKRNPFEAFVTARQNIKALAQSEEDVMSQLKAHEDNQAYAQKMLDMLAEIEVARAEYTLGDLQGETLALFQSLRSEVFAGNKNAFKDAREEYEGLLAKAKEGADLTSGQIKMFAQYRQSLQGISDYWGAINDQIQNITGSAVNIMEAYGVDEATKSIAEGVGSMSTLITQAVQFGIQMELVGYKSNMALGVIGWIAMGIQAISTVITAIANYKNAKIDEQLEKQAKTIERQRDLYEELEKKVEAAYNVDQLRQYNNEMERNIELEIQALEASIRAERSRKRADEDQIADWQKEITEARERLAESKQEMMEELGGMFDITDFTSGFVDAWWDAMDEGKSGLDALSEHFEETMKDLVKKQALYQGANAIMKQVQDVINQDLADDYDIDDWQKIWDVAKKANVDLDAFLQGWYDMFGGLSDGASGGLSALQKGIQGITSEQAEILAAYWNSVRGYTASIDSKMDLILANMGAGTENNPMLEQLRSQTGYLMTIKDVLSGASSFEARAIWVKLAGQN